MKTKEELIEIYNKRTRKEFEYYLNNFVRDYNNEVVAKLKQGEMCKFTDFFKSLEAILKHVDDKYNYTELINKHKANENS
jgi:hypothetical protein